MASSCNILYLNFQANPLYALNLKVIKNVVLKEWNALILPKNSPLSPILQEGINSLHESGVMQNILEKWKGGIETSSDDFQKSILSAGQTSLVYLILSFAVIISSACLLGELITSYMNKNSKEKPEKVWVPHGPFLQ